MKILLKDLEEILLTEQLAKQLNKVTKGLNMNVSLIGSGGREHALALKIAESPTPNKLFILPGNPGTRLLGENISINLIRTKQSSRVL